MSTGHPDAPAVARGSAERPAVGAGLRVVGVLVAGVVALVVLVLAGLLTGIFAEPLAGLPDLGAAVRVGLPVSRVLHDLAAAMTVGLLLLAATIVPESRTTSRRIAATRLACLSAMVWFAAGLTNLVLTFADISGVPVTDPSFPLQLRLFVLDVETTRVAAISLLVAFVVLVGSALARTRAAMVALSLLSLAALLPLALGGHAAGTADHDTAVNSLAVHLLATTVWVGGLLALVVLRPVLGPALTVSAQRYSTLAGWCFCAVAASGLLNAWVRLGGLPGLASSYGVLVVLKATALVALGVAGWQQRRHALVRLAATDVGGRAFARLALLEIAVMGAAFGLAAALSRSAPPRPESIPPVATPALSLTGHVAPAEPLGGLGWVTTWRVDWLWLSVALLAVALYLAGIVRMHRRGDRWPVLRTVSWAAGWLLFVWVTNGAPGTYGRLLFSVHMVMHMVLAMVVPIMLVLAAPVTLALRTLKPRPDRTLGPRELLLGLVHSRYLGVLGNLVVAAGLFFGSLVVFYYSGLFELALRTHTGHVLMVLHFLGVGYLFAWALVGVDPGPRRWPPSLRLVVLFATISFHAFFGVALTTQNTLLAPGFYERLALPWPVDLLADQQRGGAIAWGVGELPTLALALLVAAAWVRSDATETRRKDRQADRDDDAELKAYNAALAARAASARAPGGAASRSPGRAPERATDRPPEPAPDRPRDGTHDTARGQLPRTGA